eukprot:TRINITY_DN35408_c0_g1_i1.p2 TRINITY_DN35408_c0_g1~~TRINITY_DN35408_c0_g1_i1.p2  ORF type:complete len:154 (-),score=38.51 TRINITY_DN35408_c0_g1_i1:43-480(-)
MGREDKVDHLGIKEHLNGTTRNPLVIRGDLKATRADLQETRGDPTVRTIGIGRQALQQTNLKNTQQDTKEDILDSKETSMAIKETTKVVKAVILDTRGTSLECQTEPRDTYQQPLAVINLQVQAATKTGVKGHLEVVQCMKLQKH